MDLTIVTSPTGGHLIPAVLVGQGAKDRGHRVQIWSSERVDPDWLPSFNGSFRTLSAHPWAGQGPVGRLSSLATVIRGWLESRRALLTTDAVLGFGGFASVPILLAAWERGIPIFLHEQNRIPGRVTRLFEPFAREVFFGFPPEDRFSARATVIGTPIREAEEKVDSWFENQPLLVVVGGSQGARSLTDRLNRVADRLLAEGWYVYLLHGKHGSSLSDLGARHPDRFRSERFHADLPSVLRRARVVWSRAGAGTLSELIRYDRPAVLFPYPHAADDHQRHNAEFVARIGPARVADEDLSDRELIDWTRTLARNRRNYSWSPGPDRPEDDIVGMIEQCVDW